MLNGKLRPLVLNLILFRNTSFNSKRHVKLTYSFFKVRSSQGWAPKFIYFTLQCKPSSSKTERTLEFPIKKFVFFLNKKFFFKKNGWSSPWHPKPANPIVAKELVQRTLWCFGSIFYEFFLKPTKNRCIANIEHISNKKNNKKGSQI